MSIFNTGFLKNISDWVDRKKTPFVNSANIEFIYTHAQSASLTKTITVQHLDITNTIIAEDVLLDSKSGNSHRLTCKVYGNFFIKVTNTSASSINFSINLLNNEGITENVETLRNVGAGGSYTTSSLIGKIKSKNPIYKVFEERTFGFDNLVVDGVLRRIFSIAVDFEGSTIIGGTQNRPPLLSKYNSEGELVWTRDSFNPSIAIGNITTLSTDLNGNIYAGDATGRLYKIPYNGDLSEWNSDSFGANVIDSHVDKSNNIYAVGGINVRKYSESGTLLWQYQFGASSTVRSIDVDLLGNVYVGVRDLGTTNKIVKLDQSAANDVIPPTIIWQETITNLPNWVRVGYDNSIYYVDLNRIYRKNQDGSGFTDTLFNLVVNVSPNDSRFVIDIEGNIYVNNAGSTNSVISKYSPLGLLIWQITKKTPRNEAPIALDFNEDVYYAAWGKVTKLKSDLQLTGYK